MSSGDNEHQDRGHPSSSLRHEQRSGGGRTSGSLESGCSGAVGEGLRVSTAGPAECPGVALDVALWASEVMAVMNDGILSAWGRGKPKGDIGGGTSGRGSHHSLSY